MNISDDAGSQKESFATVIGSSRSAIRYQVQADTVGLQVIFQRSIQLLVLTIILHEGRLGVTGIKFPTLEIGSNSRMGLPFLSEVALLTAVAICVLALGTRHAAIPTSWDVHLIGWLLYFIVLAVALASLMGVRQSGGQFGSMRMLVEGLLLFIAVRSMPWDASAVATIVYLFVFGAALHAVVILISHFGPELIPFQTNIIQSVAPRYAGLFLQPSRVSFLLGLGVVSALSLYLYDHRAWYWPAVCLIALPLLVGALLLTQTRTFLLAVPLVSIWGIFTGGRRHGPRSSRYFILFLLTAMLAIIIRYATPDLFSIGWSRFFSLSIALSRGWIWAESIRVMLDYPLGTGFSSLIYLSGQLEIPHAHNMYLQWGVMFGWPALVLFLVFLGKLLQQALDCLSGTTNNDQFFCAAISVCSAWLLCLLAFLSEPYLVTNTGYWFWLFSALLFNLTSAPAAAGRVDI